MRHYILVLSLVSLWLVLQKNPCNLFFHAPSVDTNDVIKMPPIRPDDHKPTIIFTSFYEPCDVNRATLLIMYGLESRNLAKFKERPRAQIADIIQIRFRKQRSS
ncbi:MAG: hypothetical protein AAB575_02810 [Patescibacteria group bacterium]